MKIITIVSSGEIEHHKNKGDGHEHKVTDSGQNKLTPSQNRSMERSKTYLGIADAMADQWGAVKSVKRYEKLIEKGFKPSSKIRSKRSLFGNV